MYCVSMLLHSYIHKVASKLAMCCQVYNYKYIQSYTKDGDPVNHYVYYFQVES